MKATWRASFLWTDEQANQCNNAGETEEIEKWYTCSLEHLRISQTVLCNSSGKESTLQSNGERMIDDFVEM